MCTDLTAPGPDDNITITYMAPVVDPTANAAILTVGDVIHPEVEIRAGGLPQPRARFAIRPARGDSVVVHVDSGTVVHVVGRGQDTLLISPIGATINAALSDSLTIRVPIIASAATNVILIDALKATLKSIGDTTLLQAVAKDSKGDVVRNTSVEWISSDPTVLAIDSVTTGRTGRPDSSFAVVTARSRGTATIRAVFEKVDTVTQVVAVDPQVQNYVFERAAIPNVPVTSITFNSVNDTVTLRAIARDAGGTPVVPAPVPVFTAPTSTASQVTVDPNTGLVRAVSNTAAAGVNVSVVGFPNDVVNFNVTQLADSIRIQGARTINLGSIDSTATLTAIVFDARRNVMANNGNTWSAANSTLIDINDVTVGTIRATAVGTTQVAVTRDGKTDAVTVIVSNDPQSVVVTPDPLALKSVGEVGQVNAKLFNAKGADVTASGTINWTSLDPSIATVASATATTGAITAVARGDARIVGTTAVGTGADTLIVHVTNNPNTVSILPTTVTIASIGDTLAPPVPVDFRNALNASLPRNSVTWGTLDQTIARPTLDGLGGIVATGKGETRIIATSADGAADTVGVIVTNAPATVVMNRTNDNLTALSQTLQYTADVFNGRGALLPAAQLALEPVIWRSSNPAIVDINSSGLATALATGTVQIFAEIGASSTGLRADTATLVVTNSAVAMTVTPNTAAITSVGSTRQLSASATNNAGGTVNGQTFNWASSDLSIATVDGSGLVTAVGTGTVTITASIPSSSLSAPATITVTNDPTSIAITETATNLASVNDVFTPTIDFRNAALTPLPITSATWTSDDPLIATVTSSGVITAKAPGTTKVRAISPSNAAVRDSIIVTVSNAAATITLNPSVDQTLTSFGQTLSLTATVLNAAGQPISNPTVTWDVPTGPAFVSVATSGVATSVVTAVANGAAVVRATSGGITQTINVTVAQVISPSLSTVTASPTSVAANNTATSTITVQLKDANGQNYLGPQPAVTMTVGGTPITMTGNGTGGYTATHPASPTSGSSIVSVTAGTLSLNNTAIVNFTAGTAAQYSVTSSSFSPVAGNSVTITAQLKDGNGNNVGEAGRIITWSSLGGGSFGAATSTTNASGVATVSFTTASSSVSHFVTATDNGTPSLTGTTAAITTVAGAATKYILTPATATSVAAGSSITISGQLTDVNNVPVGTAGHVFTWSSNNGGSFSAPTSTTDANGRFTVDFTPATAAGTAATVSGVDGNSRPGSTGVITTIAGSASQLTVTTAPSASAQSGVAIPQQPVLQLRDASGNAVSASNVSVTAILSSGSGSLGGVTTVQTNGSGVATFSGLSISGAAGAMTITFSSSGLTSPAASGVTLTSGVASQMALNGGNGQSAAVGTAVATAPSVVVRDAAGNPVAGVSVAFAVTGGAGSVSGSPATTDASGVATLTSWTLGAAAGTNTVQATVGGLTGSPVTFTATGTAGTATNFLANSSTSQTGTVGSAVAAPSVIVRDASNNPVAGFSVTFTLTAAGGTGAAAGSISPATAATVVSNSSGVASLSTWSLGLTAGAANTVVASGGILTPVTFSATSTAGAAQNIVASSATSQTATVGTGVTAPSVTVRDANNNPVGGVVVTFAVSGGGSISGSPATTNSSGVATLTSWTLGNTAGTNTVQATVAGLSGSPVVFTATGTAGTADHFAANSATSQSGTVGTAVAAPSVIVRDVNNNPVAGFSVTFTLTAAGGSGAAAGSISPATAATVVTNSSGIASLSTWSLGLTAGAANTVVASGSGLTNMQFDATSVAATSQNIVPTIGTTTSQSATVGTLINTAGLVPSVTVRDANSNPVAGVVVTFTVTGGNGSTVPASGSTLTTDASGIAKLTSWTLGTTAGANTVAATVSGLSGSPVVFTATGTAGAASTLVANSATTQSGTVGSAVAAPSVIVRDANNNPVAGFSVTFTLSAAGGTGAAAGAISPTTPATVVSNSAGVASLSTWVLGLNAGTNNNTVSASGVGTPVTFNASGTTGAAQNIIANSTTSQLATVGTPATAPSVIVRDANNNPVSGVSVSFAVTAGGGSIGTSPVTTDASGVATLASWTLGTAIGTNTVEATVAGLTLSGEPVVFNATGTAAVTTAAQSTVAITGSSTVIADGTSTTTIVVTAKDANGNPVAGKTIALGSNDGNATTTITPASGTSNASGQVTFTVKNTQAEAITYTATVTDPGAVVVTQTAIVTFVAGTVSASQSTVSAAPSPVTANGSTTSTVTVTLKDAQGNPVSGKTVSLARTGTTSVISAPSGASNGAGVVTFTVTNTTAETVTYTATASDPGAIAITQTASVVFQAGVETNSIALTSQSQTAAVDATVTAPSVRVRDAQNNPVAGVTVTFSLVSSGGGGLINAGTADVPVVTNGSGIASLTSWKLGPNAGANTVTAATTSAGSVVFTATGTAGAPTAIASSGAPSTSATVGTAVATPPAVLVTDTHGNPVSGASVTFTLTSNGGTGGAIAPVSPATVLTGSNGIATLTSWTLGQTAGTNNNTVEATTTGVGTTVTFNASGNAGAPQNIISNSTTSQSATVNTAATAPSVLVRDAFNNPVDGVVVTFTTTAGTGSTTGSPVTTVGGVATLSSWTLGTTAGTNTVEATVGALMLSGEPVVFNATGTPSVTTAAQSTVAITGSSTVIADGTSTTTIVVTAKDANGNPVAGKTIALGSNDGNATTTITPASGTSNASGQVTFTVKNTQAEAITYTATVTDPGAVVVTQTAVVTFVAGTVSASQSTVSAAPSPVTANGSTTSTVTVTLKDAQGNPVSGKTVSLARTGTTSVISAPSGASNGAGVVTFTVTNTTAETVTYTATANDPGAIAITQTASVVFQAGAETNSIALTSTSPTNTVDLTVTAPSVRVRDAQNNPVAGVTVTFSLVSNGVGGQINGGTADVPLVTDASGVASLMSWKLGPTAGANTVTAATTNAGSVVFTATGTAGAATTLITSGTPSTSATVGTAVSTPPAVLLTDTHGNPVAGASITFTLTTPSGSGSAIAPVSPAVIATNSSGIATLTSWTLGQTAGTNTVTATAGCGGCSVPFNATGTAGSAQNIIANSTTAQSATVGTVATAPSVLVRDANNNPVNGAVVTFTTTAGNGTTNPTSGNTVTTGSNGIATLTSWTLGATAGTNTIEATVSGLSGSPVVFNATGTASVTTAAQSTVVITGSSTIVADNVATTTIVVTARDANGNPVSGKTITLDDGAATSNISPASGTTNAAGQVTFTVKNTKAEAATYTATVTDGGPVVVTQTVIVTFVAGTVSASQSTVTAPAGDVTANGTATKTITVTLLDANNNPVAGKTVTLDDAGSTSVITPASGTSNASGVVTFTVKNGTAELVTYTATATDGTAITITDTEDVNYVPGAAANMLALTTQTQNATVNTAAVAPSVRVRDALGNPVGGVNVTFTLTGSGTGSAIDDGITQGAGPLTVVSNATTGIASLVGWTLGQTAGSNTITVSTAGATNVVFTATGTAGTAATIATSGTPSTSATVGTQVATPPAVIARDAFSNPVSGASITFTLTTPSGSGSAIGPVSPAVIATNSSGIATLTSWTLGQTAGTNTVTATASCGGCSVPFNATGTAGSAQNIIANSTTSQSATAGTTVTAPPSVLVRDAFNNPVDGITVTFAVTGGGGSVAPVGGSVATAGGGIATLTSWTLGTTAGGNTLTATVAGLSGSPVTFSASGVAGTSTIGNSTVVRTGANNIVADGTSSSTIVVTAKDANNNPVAGKTITLDDGAASSSISPASGTSDANGQVTFSVTNTVGETATYTATITDGAAIVVTQQATVTFRAGTNYLVTAANPTPTAGSIVIITAQLRDAGNANVPQSGKTVVWSKLCNAIACAAGATGGNFATPTSLTDATGKATVALTVSTDASIDMTVTATDNEALTGTSGTIDITHAAASQVALTAATTNLNSGDTRQLTATIKDAFGNTVTTGSASTASVTFAKTAGAGTVTGLTSAPASGGVAQIMVAGAVEGSITLQATTATPSLTSNTLTFTVIPSETAASIVLSGATGNLNSGDARQITATLKDAAGNTVTAGAHSTTTVTFAKSGGAGTVTGLTSTAAVAGVAQITVTGAVEGSIDLQATTATPALTSNTLTFSVIPSETAASIVLSGSTADLTSGATRQFTATLKDAAGNTVTAGTHSTTSVTFAKTAGAGTVTGLTSVAAVAGVANIDLTGELEGSITIRATTATPLLTSNPLTFNVIDGAATQVIVETMPDGSGAVVPPQSITSGSSLTVYSIRRDAAGNFIDNVASDSWALTNVAGGVVNGDLVPAGDNKSAVFTGAVIGSANIEATSGALTKVPSGTITVTPGAASTAVTASTISSDSPTVSISAGTPTTVTITVQLKDAAGNNTTGTTGTVAILIDGTSDGSATLGSTVDNLSTTGIYSQVLTPTLAGDVVLKATLNATQLNNPATITVTVVP